MRGLESKIGEVYVFENGHKMEVIEYFGAKNITIKFDDGVIYKNATYDNFINGRVKNYNYPIVNGVGCFGYGRYSRKTHRLFYELWKGMLGRCYNESELLKRPTYRGCSVDPYFLNFQNFANWCEVNYVEGFRIDKDILVKRNKIYSPDTCCFVPVEINSLFILCGKNRGNAPVGVLKTEYNKYMANVSIGNVKTYLGTYDCELEAFSVYKKAKEDRIKFLAKKNKPKITPNCYSALMNWEMDIND